MHTRGRPEENAEYIIESYLKGYSANKIAKELDLNVSTLCHFLKVKGVLRKPTKKTREEIQAQKEKIIDLYVNQDVTIYRIAKMLDFDQNTVRKVLINHGVDTSKNSSIREKGNQVKDYKEQIIKMYEEGYNTYQIADSINCVRSSVTKVLKKAGVKIRDNTTHSVNESYFSKIDTPNKAYILGWFYSDGCVDDLGRCSIKINSDDGYILEWMKEELEFTGQIYPREKEGNRKPQVDLCICRQSMAQDLIKLGCVPRKSLILKFPTFDIVPRHLMSHFLRGMFDGDGCITSKWRTVNLTTTIDFALAMEKFLQEEIGIKTGKYYMNQINKITVCYFFKKECGLKFLRYIYKDAEVFLKRKRELARI